MVTKKDMYIVIKLVQSLKKTVDGLITFINTVDIEELPDDNTSAPVTPGNNSNQQPSVHPPAPQSQQGTVSNGGQQATIKTRVKVANPALKELMDQYQEAKEKAEAARIAELPADPNSIVRTAPFDVVATRVEEEFDGRKAIRVEDKNGYYNFVTLNNDEYEEVKKLIEEDGGAVITLDESQLEGIANDWVPLPKAD